jgi:hypothetical protein
MSMKKKFRTAVKFLVVMEMVAALLFAIFAFGVWMAPVGAPPLWLAAIVLFGGTPIIGAVFGAFLAGASWLYNKVEEWENRA